MNTPLRCVALLLTVSTLPLKAGPFGQTVRCPSRQAAVRQPALMPAADDDIRRGSTILKHWSSDFLPSTRADSTSRDSLETSLASRLQDTLGPRLAPTLLAILAQPHSTSPFRVTPLQSAAAYFYVRGGFPDSLLEVILLSPNYEMENRVSVFKTIWARDLPQRRLTRARILFACTIAREFTAVSSDQALQMRNYIAEILGAFELERSLGSDDARALLDDALLRTAVERVRALDSIPEPENAKR